MSLDQGLKFAGVDGEVSMDGIDLDVNWTVEFLAGSKEESSREAEADDGEKSNVDESELSNGVGEKTVFHFLVPIL